MEGLTITRHDHATGGEYRAHVPGSDAVTYATITAILIAVGLAACVVPAARASRIDPVRALRADG